MMRPVSFTFSAFSVDPASSTVRFTYRVGFKHGIAITLRDRLVFEHVPQESWGKIPKTVLEPTLQALLLMIGINYWAIFPTKNIRIDGFSLTRAQAQFWDSLYLNGLAEFFYDMQMDFDDLIAFPYDDTHTLSEPTRLSVRHRALLLNGAGKDSILSAEILKAEGMPFDFFVFSPTPAHERIAKLVGAETVQVRRQRDWKAGLVAAFFNISGSYPSVSTFTFVATLLAQLLGYDSIIFSNERSADSGNLMYRGLPVNHQWCKSSEAERMINDYIRAYITPDIRTYSLLREFSELEIVRRFVRYPQYLSQVTSCNSYFWLPPWLQRIKRRAYWCKRCPKCVFLFASYSAFLPKNQVIDMFETDLYTREKLIPLFRRILGIEGFKPLDCVGEPEEMILAMHYASRAREYQNETAMRMFEQHFASYDFDSAERRVFEFKDSPHAKEVGKTSSPTPPITKASYVSVD